MKIKRLKKQKNYGLNWKLELKHRKPEDWLGGVGICIAEIPPAERELMLPLGEMQNIGSEKFDCASRAPLNILEAKLDWLLINNKLPTEQTKFLQQYIVDGKIALSDRWIAIMSGTDPNSGNSLIAPLDAIHNFGIVPKKLFPQTESKEEYYETKNITDEIKAIAKQSLTLFSFNYSRLSEAEFPQFLTRDMLVVGGYAWPSPVNNEYPRVPYSPNHAFVIFNNPSYFAFDNYTDNIDDSLEDGNSFVKKLASDYDFLDTGYRLLISLKKGKRNWLIRLLALLKRIIIG